MRPPVTLDTLSDEWEKDAVIDRTNLQGELAKLDQLHAKYLRILNHHSMRVKLLDDNYEELYLKKWEYYQGDLNNPEDLKKYGLEPQLKKILRADLPIYMGADPDLRGVLAKKALNEQIVKATEAILKKLHSRNFEIRAYIDWEKFQHGVG